MPDDDPLTYSIEHVLYQSRKLNPSLGYFTLRFYSENGRPSKRPTAIIEEFYYFPSGGTIRDRDMNILFYEPRLDQYHDRKFGRPDTTIR